MRENKIIIKNFFKEKLATQPGAEAYTCNPRHVGGIGRRIAV
jgi:hypothetical protein